MLLAVFGLFRGLLSIGHSEGDEEGTEWWRIGVAEPVHEQGNSLPELKANVADLSQHGYGCVARFLHQSHFFTIEENHL